MKYNGVVSSITLGREIEPDFYECVVLIDDFDSYTLFAGRDEYMEFIGKEVEFSTRRDSIGGVMKEVISTIAVKSVVQSVDVDPSEDFDLPSLIPNQSKTVNIITFNKNLLKKNDIAQAQIVLVVGYKDGKSKVTKWKDFSCLDCNSAVFNLRLFTNDDHVDEFAKKIVGKYAMVDIKNSSYGLQVAGNFECYEQEVLVPSEVSLAALKLTMIVRRDEELQQYVTKYDFINYLKSIIYFEPGYHLVEMAAELMLIDTMCRIFDGYDRKLLYRAVFASRGYLLGSATNISNLLVNYHRTITTELKNDFDLIRLLDFATGVEEGDLNKGAYLSVRRQITSIMKERRGICETSSINTVLTSIDAEYSGLFKQGFVELD